MATAEEYIRAKEIIILVAEQLGVTEEEMEALFWQLLKSTL